VAEAQRTSTTPILKVPGDAALDGTDKVPGPGAAHRRHLRHVVTRVTDEDQVARRFAGGLRAAFTDYTDRAALTVNC
jgi:hypothetical protein